MNLDGGERAELSISKPTQASRHIHCNTLGVVHFGRGLLLLVKNNFGCGFPNVSGLRGTHFGGNVFQALRDNFSSIAFISPRPFRTDFWP